MSDLLNSASLVIIPSGYKEDVVYSQIPTNGNGDLSFTRASNGTRINSAGLVEVCPWNFIEQSSNLGSWSNDGVTITTGITDAYGTTNAVTMSNIGSGNNTEYIARFNNTMDLPGGAQINYSAYLKGSGTIGLAIERGNTGDYFFTSQIVTLTSAWVRYDFAYTMPAGTRNGIHFYVTNLTGTTATSVDICFPQINYGSTAKPYFPTTDRLNVPRLTYQNGGGGCPSLLLEKQSTNLVTYSEQFDNAAWSQLQSTVTANNTISPDGTQNADKIIPSTVNTYHYLEGSAVTVSNNAMVSIYAKKGEYQRFALRSYITGNNAIFDVNSGTVVGTTNTTASIQSVGNGWYRCSLNDTNSTAWGMQIFVMQNTSASPTDSYSGNGTDGMFFWGAQIEVSSYPTSYIPTTSSSATRVADACYKTGISSLIGQTEGSVFFDFTVDTISGQTNDPVLWYMKDGGTGERYVELYSDGRLIYLEYNGATIATITKTGLTVGRHKCAVAYANNDMTFYVDGVQIGTDTSGTPSAFSTFAFQYYNSVYSGQQKVNQAALFPTRLTNAELASLTTI